VQNNWRIYSNEILLWELQIPGKPSDPVIRRWEREVLDAAEEHAVFRVQAATGRRSAMDYHRDRDGYLGDVLDAHPEYLAPPGQPEVLLFASLEGTSRLAYVDIHDQIREAETEYLYSLPDLKAHSWHQEGKPALEFMCDAEPNYVWLSLSSFSSIWLPWELNDGLDDDLPDEAFVDNRALAQRHTPRLNAFLADLNKATLQAGGRLALNRRETYPEYFPFVDDHGIRLDAPEPEPQPQPNLVPAEFEPLLMVTRLFERGLDTTPLSRIGEPYGSILVRAVDLMTQGTPPTDRAANMAALTAAQRLVRTNSLPAMAELVQHHGRLQNRADMAQLISDIGQENDPANERRAPDGLGQRRVLEDVALLLLNEPEARVAWDSYVDIAHQDQPGRYRADYLRTDTGEAYQVKTLTTTNPRRQHLAIEERLILATAQLNGMAGASVNGPAEQAPPGYLKVARLRLEPQMGDYFLMNREELIQVLRRIEVYPKIRDGRLDRLEIVNGFNGYATQVWTADQLRQDLGRG